METRLLGLTSYENFLFGMKAAETRRQYPHRLDKFLTFMSLQGTIEEKCTKLYEIANENVDLLQANIIRFINSQRERIEKKLNVILFCLEPNFQLWNSIMEKSCLTL
jgi:hypothetical protein